MSEHDEPDPQHATSHLNLVPPLVDTGAERRALSPWAQLQRAISGQNLPAYLIRGKGGPELEYGMLISHSRRREVLTVDGQEIDQITAQADIISIVGIFGGHAWEDVESCTVDQLALLITGYEIAYASLAWNGKTGKWEHTTTPVQEMPRVYLSSAEVTRYGAAGNGQGRDPERAQSENSAMSNLARVIARAEPLTRENAIQDRRVNAALGRVASS